MGGQTGRSRLALAVLAAAGCAPSRALCPPETTVARHVYSGGGDAEWCRRADGVRSGPESRVYENGVESAAGAYVDGAQSGVWRYRFNDGRNWRAERWEDGALTATVVDPVVARMSADELASRGATTSGVIKLAAHDPARDDSGGHELVTRYPNGALRMLGRTDAEGLRTGIWRVWFQDGRLASEIEFAAGVRDRAARQWHPNGAPAVEGFYAGGIRDGRWRFWDDRGQLIREIIYDSGIPVSPVASPARMLPAQP